MNWIFSYLMEHKNVLRLCSESLLGSFLDEETFSSNCLLFRSISYKTGGTNWGSIMALECSSSLQVYDSSSSLPSPLGHNLISKANERHRDVIRTKLTGIQLRSCSCKPTTSSATLVTHVGKYLSFHYARDLQQCGSQNFGSRILAASFHVW